MSDFEKKYYELLNLTADMRAKQRKYFSEKMKWNLDKAKVAEAKVDAIIKEEILNTQHLHSLQSKLF